MPRSRLENVRDLSKTIKAVAYRRLAEHGTGGLSLRAIARDLEITAPAIYNYYRRLDDLITALVVDAFTALGEALAVGVQACPADDHVARVKASGLAYRAWALAYPERYNLIFGTPIPGYTAPEAITRPAAAIGLEVLIRALEEARQAGQLPVRDALWQRHPALRAQIDAWRQLVGSQAHPYCHYLALVIWPRVHGLVSIELYHQLPPGIAGETLYALELENILRQIGLE